MKKETILICDDNEYILKMVRFTLEANGFIVESAMSTGEIYRKIEANKPSLIILDLNLPEDGGESVVHNLQNRIETRDIPIVLFSASENISEIATKLKVNGFLQKPFDNEALVNIANSFIHQT